MGEKRLGWRVWGGTWGGKTRAHSRRAETSQELNHGRQFKTHKKSFPATGRRILDSNTALTFTLSGTFAHPHFHSEVRDHESKTEADAHAL